MLTPEDVARHAEMLGNRVRKNLRTFGGRFESEAIGAFRLFDRDIPEVRAVVDWYEGHVVVGEYERTQTEGLGWLEAMGEACGRALQLPRERVHLRRRRARPKQGERHQRPARKGERLIVRERPLRFLVNLDDDQDTGLFTDHRVTRRLVREESGGRSVLSLHGGTGTFTCAAAVGGARLTTTVDPSQRHLAWARDNLELNARMGAQHALVRAEAHPFLREARARRERWELIVLDPPSFSAAGESGDGFDVQRDHRALIEQALGALEPGGVLWFSTRHQRFEPQLDGLAVAECRDLTEVTMPPDHRNRQVHRCWRMIGR